MKYAHILNYVATTPWAIDPDKMQEILAVLAHRAAGHVFSAEEIQSRIGEPTPPTAAKRGAVAIVPLRGVIAHRLGSMEDSSGGMSTERFRAMFAQAVADESVGTIVLDVDSPGGTVAGVPEAASDVFNARASKRIIAVANAKMASAAYWIAAQAHELVAIPSAFDRAIGSVGIYCVHQNLSAALEKNGVKIEIIKAGKHKTDANPFEPLSDETRAALQSSVDQAYAAFVKDVARGRGVSVDDVKNGYGEGRALSAKDAKAAGLIDRIASMDDVIGRLVGRRTASGMRAEAHAGGMTFTHDEPVSAADSTGIVDPVQPPVQSDVDADLRRRVERF